MLLQVSGPESFLFIGTLENVENPEEKKQLQLSRPQHFLFTGARNHEKTGEKDAATV